MAREDLKQAIATLLEIVSGGRETEVEAAREELRAKIAEMRAAGLPVPADLRQFEDQPPEDDGEDTFENMPI